MGKGLDLARELSEESAKAAQVIDDFKDQLLLALIIKYGPGLSIPIRDVDATGGYVLEMGVDGYSFNFKASKKQ